jgi:hypothetical protein
MGVFGKTGPANEFGRVTRAGPVLRLYRTHQAEKAIIRLPVSLRLKALAPDDQGFDGIDIQQSVTPVFPELFRKVAFNYSEYSSGFELFVKILHTT